MQIPEFVNKIGIPCHTYNEIFQTKQGLRPRNTTQKKKEGTSRSELIASYKSFNLDKTKISKWMKNKEYHPGSLRPQKEKSFHDSIRDILYWALLAKFNDVRSKGHHVNFNWLWSKGRKEGDEKADLKNQFY